MRSPFCFFLPDQVSICYGEDYTTRRLFEQYGFAPAEGTAADARTLRELVEMARNDVRSGVVVALAEGPSTPLTESQVGIQALGAAFQEVADSPLSTEERRGAIFDALTGEDSADGKGEAVAAVPPAALLAAVRWQINQFPTSLDHDEEILEQLLEQGGADPRPIAVLNYRIARKSLLELTQLTLSTFLGV